MLREAADVHARHAFHPLQALAPARRNIIGMVPQDVGRQAGAGIGDRDARDRLGLTATLFGEDSTVLALERLSFTDRLAEHGLFEPAVAGFVARLEALKR